MDNALLSHEEFFRDLRDNNILVREILYQANLRGICVFPSAILESDLFFSIFYNYHGIDNSKLHEITNWKY